MIRKTACVGFSFLAGLFIASFFEYNIAIISGVAMLILSIAYFIMIKPKTNTLAFRNIIVIIAMGIGAIYYSAYMSYNINSLALLEGEEVTLTLSVTEIGSLSEDSRSYIAKGSVGAIKNVKVYLYAEDVDVIKGDNITVCGTIGFPQNSDSFNAKDFYYSKGVFITLSSASIISYTNTSASVYTVTSSLRKNIISTIRKALLNDEGELLIGMMLGNNYYNLDSKTESLIYRSGIGHITAVSGMHLAIMSAVVMFICTHLKVNRKASAIITVVITGLFMVMCDFSVSVVRAFIMVAIIQVIAVLIRKKDALTSLAIAGVILTIASPYVIRNTGFLLSISAVFGSSVLAPDLIKYIEDSKSKKRAYNTFDTKYHMPSIMSGLITSAAISVAITPVYLLSFDEISIISPLTNALLSPIISFSIIGGFIGVVLTIISLNSIAIVVFKIVGVAIKIILYDATLLGGFNAAVIPLGFDITKTIIILSVFIVALTILLVHDKKYLYTTVAICMATAVVCTSIYRIYRSDDTVMEVLSDGSGCVVVCSNGNSATIIDMCASKNGVSLVTSYLARNGITHIDSLILTKKIAYTTTMYQNTIYSFDEVLSASDDTCYSEYITVTAYDNSTEISIYGATILCVYNANATNTGLYDMVIYTGKKDIDVIANIYVVTNSNFTGDIPTNAYIESANSSYIIDNYTISKRR